MDYNYNNVNIKRRSGKTAYDRRGKKRAMRLWLCLGIFALAVCIRAVAPGFSRDMSAEVLDVIDSSVDYRSAFEAVGSFVSGEYTLGEAIAALKRSGEPEAEPVAAEQPESSGAAENNLQSMYLQCLDAGLRRMQQEQAAPVVADGESAVIYETEAERLPDNVCAEFVKLPFEYTRPVDGEKSSDFGYRLHPIENVKKFHYGIDFAADEGTDIYAFADGHVAASGISETAGKYLIISHGNGWTTRYFHCNEVYAVGGSKVERGQVVAAVGQTGAATGPNLHFELMCDGIYHDPGLYLNEKS